MFKEAEEDTIAAISTPIGEGGIGVLRLSGKQAISIADKIFKAKSGKGIHEQKSFTVQYGHLEADEALLLVMRGPKSYTREDVVEISVHAGQAVLGAALGSALKHGARLAAPGEFTKRAFLNGRIDLLQAEAVLDLIQAKTERSLHWAASQLKGDLSKKVQAMKESFIQILSHLEASIDFPDDFPETKSLPEIAGALKEINENLKKLLSSSDLGILAKRGIRVVIAGRPNVGKSSLMNQLVKRDRVIVTPYPGTTRDVVEEEIQIQGFPVRVLDTAGIQETEHPIEKEGIERSRQAAQGADLVLLVLDGSREFSKEDQNLIQESKRKHQMMIVNKCDLPQKLDLKLLKEELNGTPIVECSCLTQAGLDVLEEKIVNYLTQGKIETSEEVVISSLRQKLLLERTQAAVEDAITACSQDSSEEFIAQHIRMALDELGALVGETFTYDVLDVLFNQFCIGK